MTPRGPYLRHANLLGILLRPSEVQGGVVILGFLAATPHPRRMKIVATCGAISTASAVSSSSSEAKDLTPEQRTDYRTEVRSLRSG